MTSKEGRPAGPNPRDDYEATVLDFLDKEMATVQQAQKLNKQSEEVNALVTDLLKQVITEADQAKSADKPLFDEDELFVGLPSGSQKPANLDSLVFSVPPAPQKETVRTETEPAVKQPQSPWETAATQTTHAIFGSSTAANPRKLPVKAIAALAGLAVVVGGVAYFFSRNSGKAPQSQPSAAQVAKSEIPVAPVLPQPSAAPPVTPVTPAPPSKSNAAPALKPVPAPPVKLTQPVSQQRSTKPAPANTNLNTKPEPTPAKTADEAKPPVMQPAPAAPPPAPAAAVVEKPSSPPVVENAAPAIPDKKPAPPEPQLASVVNEPPPPAPAPAPAAAPPPVVSRNLIAAVPISQASPVYPELALRTRSSGQVVMELQIDDQGKVVKAVPVSGPAIFHNAAVAAAMKWRYKPASISGVNVSSQSRVTMSFNLKK